MELRNKKTGELGCITSVDPEKITVWGGGNDSEYSEYTTLSDLCEDWEDVPEEPKEYWYITEQSAVVKMMNDPKNIPNFVERCLSIGNLFETKQEAEKAVEKLKAWKRLKDKGFEFEWVDKDNGSISFAFFNREGKITKKMWQDLLLLFGGEE